MEARGVKVEGTDVKLGVIALSALVLVLALCSSCSSPAADAPRYPFQGPWLTPEGEPVAPPSYVLRESGRVKPEPGVSP
jgi:hypothetical protein